jgi:hypothetical protein
MSTQTNRAENGHFPYVDSIHHDKRGRSLKIFPNTLGPSVIAYSTMGWYLSTLKFGAQNEQWSVDAQLIAINAIRRQL